MYLSLLTGSPSSVREADAVLNCAATLAWWPCVESSGPSRTELTGDEDEVVVEHDGRGIALLLELLELAHLLETGFNLLVAQTAEVAPEAVPNHLLPLLQRHLDAEPLDELPDVLQPVRRHLVRVHLRVHLPGAPGLPRGLEEGVGLRVRQARRDEQGAALLGGVEVLRGPLAELGEVLVDVVDDLLQQHLGEDRRRAVGRRGGGRARNRADVPGELDGTHVRERHEVAAALGAQEGVEAVGGAQGAAAVRQQARKRAIAAPDVQNHVARLEVVLVLLPVGRRELLPDGVREEGLVRRVRVEPGGVVGAVLIVAIVVFRDRVLPLLNLLRLAMRHSATTPGRRGNSRAWGEQ
mmetsp:Transcript_118712/g.332466  ORF Transcript_118712/g.332466 Transcript_118712/m.332466 type:complete len:352 (+) Transcript_118712:131-1186(+)